jgi:xylose dehydrogenase (NAD/NADP)
MDVGTYCVNAIHVLGGEPVRVQAQQALGPSGVDVCFAATLGLPDDVVAHFDAGFVLLCRAELEAVGEEGALYLAHPWHPQQPAVELRRPTPDDAVEHELVPAAQADSYLLELENVSGAIRGVTELLLGRADATGQARALEALHRSATTGAAVELEPVPPRIRSLP